MAFDPNQYEFVTEQADYACAPRAFMNALRFQGIHAPTSYVETLAYRLCDTYNAGTRRNNLRKVARWFDYKSVERPSHRKLYCMLWNGHGVLLSLTWHNTKTDEVAGHLTFIAGIRGSRPTTEVCITDVNGEPYRWMRLNDLFSNGDWQAFGVECYRVSPIPTERELGRLDIDGIKP